SRVKPCQDMVAVERLWLAEARHLIRDAGAGTTRQAPGRSAPDDPTPQRTSPSRSRRAQTACDRPAAAQPAPARSRPGTPTMTRRPPPPHAGTARHPEMRHGGSRAGSSVRAWSECTHRVRTAQPARVGSRLRAVRLLLLSAPTCLRIVLR